MASQQISPFLSSGFRSKAESLAMLHLRRDQILPTKLTLNDENNDGYKEGPVANTRFGSFPHSTLIGLPWGSQVRASVVDTGSRGRKGLKGIEKINNKRKRTDEEHVTDSGVEEVKSKSAAVSATPVAAATGFVHILPPTVESWTASLPHRTQVVYTPDYSYILHRLRVRPGSVIIEAGAGSGSFSHAAARAVFNGTPVCPTTNVGEQGSDNQKHGRVWSYEFHLQRMESLRYEIQEHGLSDIIKITHRDVYQKGFLLDTEFGSEPQADAIFLDLPAPWLALRHLTRTALSDRILDGESSETGSQSLTPVAPKSPAPSTTQDNELLTTAETSKSTQFRSPLNPGVTVRICTFSPCIEQVQRTVAMLRRLGWVDIEMVTLNHKRIEVRRERTGLQGETQRGIHSAPATVDEALERLRQIEGRGVKSFPAQPQASTGQDELQAETRPNTSKASKRNNGSQVAASDRKLYKEGRLVHRAEPELKSHTSYLVFALLPRVWTADDEKRASMLWPVDADGGPVDALNSGASDKNLKQKPSPRQTNRTSGTRPGKPETSGDNVAEGTEAGAAGDAKTAPAS